MKKINKVLITGVAGFIGSNLLDYLIEKTTWKIVGYDNFSTGNKKNVEEHLNDERFELREETIKNISSLREYDCIFHLQLYREFNRVLNL